MKSLFYSIFALALMVTSTATASPTSRQQAMTTPLAGFHYGNMTAPTGWEWQSPDSLAYNKLQPHAWFFSFADKTEALGVLPEKSSLWQNLNGTWKFHWVTTPENKVANFFEPSFDDASWDDVTVPMCWNTYGVQKNGEQKYGTPIYSNQRVIFKHSVRKDDWKGGVMRPGPKGWVTEKHLNEVGQYRRTFTIPQAWNGKKVVINFDGVDSFFYLYINGKYVGFSTNSRNLASFDITPYLVKGENTLAVEVMRSSMASHFESQDMMRLPGIIRDVYLTATPKAVQVYDVVAEADYDKTYTNASLHVSTLVKAEGKMQKGMRLSYSLYEIPLYGDGGKKKIDGVGTEVSVLSAGVTEATIYAGQSVKPWSAENPQRYVLVGELLDKKGKVVQTYSTIVGFRKIEIRETPASEDEFGLAGRYYYLNGKPIKMKGVNRHETNAFEGHALSRQTMEKEVMLMKRANINHVRNSHYPDAPYWYYLCDKYGIYLEDEANIESHQYYYGDESLSHVKEFTAAHIARTMEMVRSDMNHPSVCLWSLGNEAGPGDNFKRTYEAIRQFDLSRPVQYERNNDIVDIGSNQYPSIPWVQEAVNGKYNIKYPYHISEYAHSMGNACGNLVDYWNAIETTNFFIGGAIWEWIDHGQYNYTPEGVRYIAYGGDFGDKPNDGMFCMDGVMLSDLTPKAQYYEVKKVYQNVGVKLLDASSAQIEVFNKNYFMAFGDYTAEWSLWKDGKQQGKATPIKNIEQLKARGKVVVDLGINTASLDPHHEYFVKVQFRLAKDMPWAEKGYVQMEEQLALASATEKAPAMAEVANGKAVFTNNADAINVSGEGFAMTFSKADGTISSLNYGGEEMFADGNGPRLDAFRAPTDNDAGIGYHNRWFANGLYDMAHKVLASDVKKQKDGTVVVSFTVESRGKNGSDVTYSNRDRNPDSHFTFDSNKRELDSKALTFVQNITYTIYGDGSVEQHSAIVSSQRGVVLPRIGYAMKLPKAMENFTYYGRGPINNYADRKASQFVERHEVKVKDAGIVISNPQAMGNREDVRWCALTNNSGTGALFVADGTMSASALPWSQQEITLAAHPHQLPVSSGTWLHLDAKVTGLGGASCGQGGPLPQDRTKGAEFEFGYIIRPLANVTNIDHMSAVAKVSANGEKPTTPEIKRNVETPLEVVFVSSQEPDDGEVDNIVDGDPTTYWHTIYSITLAKYPHWIDFDASKNITMRGFVYTPRNDNRNGRIKDYEIFVSLDGQNWGEPIARGQFADEGKPQRVEFAKAVNARYIRFRALSEQRGREYASAAEFEIIK